MVKAAIHKILLSKFAYRNFGNNDEPNKRNRYQLDKTVRVICSDPYATESSSEDEAISGNNHRRPIKPKRPKPPKRYVSEIRVPKLIERYENKSNSNSGKLNGNRKSSSGFKGVRRRPWGRYAAEIRDPFQKKRKWLGTFNTVEAAAEAYQKSKTEFEEQLGLVNQPGLIKREVIDLDLTKPCGSSKPKEKEVDLTEPCGLSKPEEKEVVDLTKPSYGLLTSPSSVVTSSTASSDDDTEVYDKKVNTRTVMEKAFGFGYDVDEEEGAIDRMLEDPLMTSSISDIFGDTVLEEDDLWVDYNTEEFNSIFDDLNFDFGESNIKTSKKKSFRFKDNKIVKNSEIESSNANTVDNGLFGSTGFPLEITTNDFQLEDFPVDDFGCFGEVDDDSAFNDTMDWNDMSL